MRRSAIASSTILVLGGIGANGQDPRIGGTGQAPELQITKVARETREVAESSVLLSGLVGGGQRANGMRAYAFQLLPGEELKIDLTSERSVLVLQFLFPTPPNAMTPAIRAANQAPKPLRQSKIQIKNPTAEPQEAVLLVGGPVNHAFQLKLSYTPAKP